MAQCKANVAFLKKYIHIYYTPFLHIEANQLYKMQKTIPVSHLWEKVHAYY